MSKWNELWEEFGSDPIRSVKDYVWRTIHLAKIKAEGDNMAFNYQKRVSICNKLYENNKELHDKLEASQEALGKTFNKLADEQQKLGAIREVADKLSDISPSVVSDETNVLIDELLEVLDGR